MDLLEKLVKEINWPKDKLKTTIELLDEGNTIPFIARYRKEMTGEMDELVLRNLVDRLEYLRNLEKRKEEVLNSIREQEKLTADLEKKILRAEKLQELEDLYLPYKKKRQTRAMKARERGLEGLSAYFFSEKNSKKPEELAEAFLDEEFDLTIEDALAGAKDIVAEEISEEAHLRQILRELLWKKSSIISKALDEKLKSPYEMYYDSSEMLKRVPPHRILAMNRGEKEKFLQVKVDALEDEAFYLIKRNYQGKINFFFEDLFLETLEDSYKRLIFPALEREIRNELTEKAEEQAIKVFSKNLHSLLLQAPVKDKIVLALDPGFRTGCKLAVVDETGKVLDTGVIFPHPPQKKYRESKEKLKEIIEKFSVDIVSIGNGTASRETELLVAELLSELDLKVQYVIVSEAGASVYSASKLAREEFPDYDVSLRSAVSIARRLQDPLAELVKIEPKAVGVGQYQHDLNPKKLDESLAQVVESCVNAVGVDINTASSALLEYVAGLTKSTAENIVKKREEEGKFLDRKELLKVKRLGPKTYEQCAGFIRIAEGKNPLDNTPVHPESYKETEKLLEKLGFSLDDLEKREVKEGLKNINYQQLSEELELGIPTLKDIVEALQKPGRDPRESLDPPLLRSDVLSIEDIKEGMILQGTVRNVVDFGAFVDIGIGQDGLIHISKLKKFVNHPMELLSVGDLVKVKVIAVDVERNRLSLSMKDI